jgi:putative CocE/NonD family hydrolase
MRDDVRLAVDVNLPPGRGLGDTHPALLELTRYGRSSEDAETGKAIPSLGKLDQFFLDHGYAVVKVDVRGSGASFGTRPIEYGPEEVRDGYDLVEWVVRQSWSDGTVGAYGTSYTWGTTPSIILIHSAYQPSLVSSMDARRNIHTRSAMVCLGMILG